MTDATAAVGDIAIDLREFPLTRRCSRLMIVAGDGDELRIGTSEYERELSETLLVRGLRASDAHGTALPVIGGDPSRVRLAGRVSVTFAGFRGVSMGRPADAGAWSVRFEPCGGQVSHGDAGLTWRPGVPAADLARLDVIGGRLEPDGAGWVARLGPGGRLLLTVEPTSQLRDKLALAPDPAADHERHLADTADDAAAWLAACPSAAPWLSDLVRRCWWVLGANTIRLPLHGGARVVVPSRLGYVAHWQWDSYFIAAGLRWGDIALAREQLDVALRHQGSDGQLPDVVHDVGVLASSEDLPPGDQESLRRAASAAAGSRVPLTKPPLTAWAVRLVHDAAKAAGQAEAAWVADLLPKIEHSQAWWLTQGDAAGFPVYAHPYSSGLDDSPVFDGRLPVATPDLPAYLLRQRAELDALSREVSGTARAPNAGEAMLTEHLESLWDERSGLYLPAWHEPGDPTPAVSAVHTVVSLLPLVAAERLAPGRAERLAAAISDERQFGGAWPVPTVARDDPSFEAQRMWRGPVWLNTNWMIIDGLRRAGRADDGRRLTEASLDLVARAGGPHEYYDPNTGERAERAAPSFSWSAALVIDLAMTAGAHAAPS